MLNAAVKRGRGRPPKKVAVKRAKKLGRPKGSKNKLKTTDIDSRFKRLEMAILVLGEMFREVIKSVTPKKGK